METAQLSPSQARLKLTLLNKQAEVKNSYEFHADMKDMGLPDEVIEILEKILKVTSKVAGQVISIGKVIVIKLLEYVAQHPLQVTGLVVGLGTTYALGVAVHGLFTLVPALAHHWWFLGGLLSKLASLIAHLCQTVFIPFMVAAPVVGVIAGEIFDKKYPEVSESLKQVAKDFFELFSHIINSLKDEFDFGEHGQTFA